MTFFLKEFKDFCFADMGVDVNICNVKLQDALYMA